MHMRRDIRQLELTAQVETAIARPLLTRGASVSLFLGQKHHLQDYMVAGGGGRFPRKSSIPGPLAPPLPGVVGGPTPRRAERRARGLTLSGTLIARRRAVARVRVVAVPRLLQVHGATGARSPVCALWRKVFSALCEVFRTAEADV